MYAYLIIAAELLILYTVFWYIFLREPKPYKVKGNPWGLYDGQSIACCDGFHYAVACHHTDEPEITAPHFRASSERYVTSNKRQSNCPHSSAKPKCRHEVGPASRPAKNTSNYGWVFAGQEPQRGIVGQSVQRVVELLGRLSMRVP